MKTPKTSFTCLQYGLKLEVHLWMINGLKSRWTEYAVAMLFFTTIYKNLLGWDEVQYSRSLSQDTCKVHSAMLIAVCCSKWNLLKFCSALPMVDWARLLSWSLSSSTAGGGEVSLLSSFLTNLWHHEEEFQAKSAIDADKYNLVLIHGCSIAR